MLNEYGKFNLLARQNPQAQEAHDGSDSHLISIKTSAHVHEKVGGDIEPVEVDHNRS